MEMRVGRKTVGIPTPCPQGLWHFVVLKKINCPPHSLGINYWMGVCLASRLPAEQLRRQTLGCISLGTIPSTPRMEGLQRRKSVFYLFSLPSVKAVRGLLSQSKQGLSSREGCSLLASNCGYICKATYQRGESFSAPPSPEAHSY